MFVQCTKCQSIFQKKYLKVYPIYQSENRVVCPICNSQDSITENIDVKLIKE
jgi:coenzyme F420-reducing hydrogenase gamma subunit